MRSVKIYLFLVFMSISLLGTAQAKLGIRVSTGPSITRAETTSDTLTITDTGSGLGFLGGLVVDYQFSDSYYFSTGLTYVVRKSKFTANGLEPSAVYNDVYTAQYLQLPISLKLYTNEIGLDKRIYFQMGGALDIKLDDSIVENQNDLVTKLSLFDTALIIGSGLEMNLGTNTAVFGGLTYQRNFLNMASENIAIDGDFSMKNAYFGLEVGVKF